MGGGVGFGAAIGVAAARATWRSAGGVVGGVPVPFGVDRALLLREVFGEEANSVAAVVCRVLLRIVEEEGGACIESGVRVVLALRGYLRKVAQCE